MIDVAQAIVAPRRGILAADESDSTIKRRFDSIGVESTFENRRDYREGLFRTAGASEFISGVILFDETIRQEGADGTPLVELLTGQGIIPGIKVDKSTKPLAGAGDEVITEGLDGLRDRLAEYVEIGAKFTKWRAVITIGDGIPSRYCIEANAQALARFAALSQEAGLVPIVEPEVLMDGDHDIDACYEATTAALREVYHELGTQRVALEGTLLKPNMVLSGSDAADRAGPEQVAEMTVRCFKNTVPGRDAGGRLPLRRAVGRRGDGEPGRHQPPCGLRRSALGAELLLWPGPTGRAPQGLGRHLREHIGGPEGLLPPRPRHLGRPPGPVHRRNGASRGLGVCPTPLPNGYGPVQCPKRRGGWLDRHRVTTYITGGGRISCSR